MSLRRLSVQTDKTNMGTYVTLTLPAWAHCPIVPDEEKTRTDR